MTETHNNGNALKAVSVTDEEIRLGNYIVLWGDENNRDLEGIASGRKNQDGSIGEYFTPETDLESDYTKTGRVYLDWEHGMGRALDGDGPDHNSILGYVDWGTLKTDTRGAWVERVIMRAHEYAKYIKMLADEGVLTNSSEAVSDLVAKAPNGKIERWPVKCDTLTVQPMEPRMRTANVMVALKAMGAILPEPETEPEAREGGDVGAAPDDGNDVTTQTEVKTMGEETINNTVPDGLDIEALLEKAAAKGAELGAKAYAASIAPPAEDKSGFVGGDRIISSHDNEEDKPWKSTGEFLMTLIADKHGRDPRLRKIKTTDPSEGELYDFSAVAGANAVGSLEQARQKARQKAISGMSEQVPADGGFLVGTDTGGSIIERMYNTGELLRRVPTMQISNNANSMTLLGVDETSRADGSRLGGVRGYWASEASEKTSSKPKFREINFKLNKVIGLVYTTDELLQDSSALESWVMSRLPDELRFKVEDAIINGAVGAGTPDGILTSNALVSVPKEAGQPADSVKSQNVIDMYSRRWIGGRNYVWLHNQDVTPSLHTMSIAVGSGGQLVYMPPGGLSGSPYGSLYGFPVIPTEYNPTVGDVGDLLLADLSQYQLVEKGGIQGASSIHVRFVYDESVFRFVYRVDGRPLWHSDLTPYKTASTAKTVSPFVTTAARA